MALLAIDGPLQGSEVHPSCKDLYQNTTLSKEIYLPVILFGAFCQNKHLKFTYNTFEFLPDPGKARHYSTNTVVMDSLTESLFLLLALA